MAMQTSSLLREIGSLKEQLERERGRRERATMHANECASAQATSEHELRRLRSIIADLEGELRSERQQRRAAAKATRASMRSLAERLPLIESAIAERATATARRGAVIAAELQHVRRMILDGSSAANPGLQRVPLLTHLDKARAVVDKLCQGGDRQARLSGAAGPSIPASQLPEACLSTPAPGVPVAGAAHPCPTGPEPLTPGLPDARVSSALAEMDAVVPRYRAAAVAAQTQAGVLKEALAVAERERDDALKGLEAWRGAAERATARVAELAAELHASRESASAAAAAAAEQLQDARHEAARALARVTELETLVQGLEESAALGRAELAEARTEAAAHRETVRQLEGTLQDQAGNVQAVLQLVGRRPVQVKKSRPHAADDSADDRHWSIGAAGAWEEPPLESMLLGLEDAVTNVLTSPAMQQ